jgi:recombination protein RecA
VGEFARSAATWSAAYNCLTIGINQTRANLSGFHSLNTPGGHAWKHATVLRIELVKGKDVEYATVNTEKMPIGYTVYGKVRKNQVGPPGRTAMWWFFNHWTPERGFGVDTLDEIARLGIKTRVLTLKGGWYHHPALPPDSKGEHKVQGLPKVKELIRSDPALRATFTSEILASLAEIANEVAPLSDPDAPIEIGSAMLDGVG